MRVLIASFLIALLLPFAALATAPLEGDWTGALELGAMRLRLNLHMTRDGDAWRGTMDSVDQGAMGIPIDVIVLEGMNLHFELTAIGGQYNGVISNDGETIKGTWQQSGQSLPLDLTRSHDPSSLVPKRPQEPKPPLPYDVEEVSYPNPRAGISIAGTLCVPHGAGPFAAVLLISGSGPQDRDESLMGHKPFLVLSDHLVRAGIAVLRVDDRGVGQSTGDYANATIADFADDVRAGVAFLKSRSEIDRARIGLAGHSEGGIVAPMVAVDTPDVAFLVLMAAPGVPAGELLARQSELLMRSMGATDAMVSANVAASQKMFAIIRAETDSAAAEEKLRAVGDELHAEFAAMDPAMAEATRAQIDAGIAMATTPWFRHFLSLDPAATLARVQVPVLAVNGSRDLQVDPGQNLPAIEKALRDGGNDDVTIRALPGLNHLFQNAQTGTIAEYGTIEETMAPAALAAITDWILTKTRR